MIRQNDLGGILKYLFETLIFAWDDQDHPMFLETILQIANVYQ